MPIKDNKYNEEAIDELRTKLLAAGMHVLYNYDIVHDIVHNIIEYLLRNKNNLNHIENIDDYVFKMLFNAINKEKKRKTIPMSRIKNIDISDNTNETSTHDIKINIIDEYLEKLDPEDKDIITMRYYIGMSVDEIVKLTNISEYSIRKKLNSIIKKMKIYILKRMDLYE